MNKKTILGSIVILILIALAGFLWPKNNPSNVSHRMSGRIVHVSGDSVLVQGVAKSDDSKIEKDVTVQFTTTQDTEYIKTVSVITIENMRSQEQFTPKFEERRGAASELVDDLRIITITSSEDLFTNNKVNATRINYSVYDFPKQPFQ